MKKITLIAILFLTCMISLQASGSNQQAAFIDNILGARAWGVGGAYHSLVDDASSMLWNPAGLADLPGKQSLTAEHIELMEFFSYSYLGFAHRLNERLVLGAGMYYSGDDIMSEMIGYLALGMDGSVAGDALLQERIPEGLISAGLTGKILYSSFGNNNDVLPDDYLQGHQVSGSATGFSLDLGFKVKPTESDHFSLTFKNLLNSVSWDSENPAGTAAGKYSENLPVIWYVGYARYQNRFVIAVDIDKSLYYDIEDNLHLGVEYMLSKEFSLRAGYAQELVTADSQRLSFGAGFNINLPGSVMIGVDLAYMMHLEWDGYDSLLFSLSLLRG